MWIAYYKDTLKRVQEGGKRGRPMKAGNDGHLALIAEEDYGHKVAVDLLRGTILIDYEHLQVQNKDMEIQNVKTVLNLCDETNVVGDIKELVSTKPNEDGWFEQEERDLIWRPIWFMRHMYTPAGYFLVKCIGAQTTLPKEYNNKNIKSFVSLFPDGRLGITT